MSGRQSWRVPEAGPLARWVASLAEVSYSRAKQWTATGKVSIDGVIHTSPTIVVAEGANLVVDMNAPKPRGSGPRVDIVWEDAHVVVIDKPAGISSVPYERGERGTAMDALRDAWRAQGKKARSVPIHVVHRIDRATSGLLMFAKSKRAELGLARQLREHTLEREYLCVAHGAAHASRIESRLVRDRGDGLRGSTRHQDQGKRAVTHVELVARAPAASLCRVRLETGKTHQIRIHLAESGHPLVGETVYVRDFEGQLLPSPRLLLHARTLGFEHPVTGEAVRCARSAPEDFSTVWQAIGGARQALP